MSKKLSCWPRAQQTAPRRLANNIKKKKQEEIESLLVCSSNWCGSRWWWWRCRARRVWDCLKAWLTFLSSCGYLLIIQIENQWQTWQPNRSRETSQSIDQVGTRLRHLSNRYVLSIIIGRKFRHKVSNSISTLFAQCNACFRTCRLP